jgi:DNA mismatch repair protein MLH1
MQNILEVLQDRRDMLEEYFSMSLDARGNLHTLPLLLKGYSPNPEKLPDFLLRLGTRVNWMEEKACFADMTREIGVFYAVEPPLDLTLEKAESGEDVAGESAAPPDPTYAKYLDMIQHILFPAFKEHLSVPQRWSSTGDIGGFPARSLLVCCSRPYFCSRTGQSDRSLQGV